MGVPRITDLFLVTRPYFCDSNPKLNPKNPMTIKPEPRARTTLSSWWSRTTFTKKLAGIENVTVNYFRLRLLWWAKVVNARSEKEETKGRRNREEEKAKRIDKEEENYRKRKLPS